VHGPRLRADPSERVIFRRQFERADTMPWPGSSRASEERELSQLKGHVSKVPTAPRPATDAGTPPLATLEWFVMNAGGQLTLGAVNRQSHTGTIS
jgi:hypothetical protein